MTAENNVIGAVLEATSEDDGRTALEEEYGQVWSTSEMTEEFDAIGFGAPFVHVRRKSDGAEGSLEFQNSPRYYFDFQPR